MSKQVRGYAQADRVSVPLTKKSKAEGTIIQRNSDGTVLVKWDNSGLVSRGTFGPAS